MTLGNRLLVVAAVLTLGSLGTGAGLLAQSGGGARATVALDATTANERRDALRELMRKYPPSLGQVLRLDPSLLASDAYLQTYPELHAYLKQHPEVARTPDYFLSFVSTPWDYEQPTAEQYQWRRVEGILSGIAAFVAAFSAAGVLLWLIRHFLAHRRWLRATKIQTDLQNKLIERLSTSDDVRTYLQSAGTSKLLAEVPPMLDASRAVTPATRILRSAQVGVASLVAGIAVIVSAYTFILPGVAFAGAVGVAVGLGFIAAAAASYVISRRLGLLAPAADAVANDRV